MKLDPAPLTPYPPSAGVSPGICPYLGGAVSAEELRSVVTACGSAVVSGKQGAKLAAKTPGVLVDPSAYAPQPKAGSETLFDYDDWLILQQAAGVPLILTDTPRIQNKDRSALHKAPAGPAAGPAGGSVTAPIPAATRRRCSVTLMTAQAVTPTPSRMTPSTRMSGPPLGSALAGWRWPSG